MAQITLKGNPLQTSGQLPAVGSKAPDFKLTNGDLADVTLADYSGKRLILNIFPSVDTPVCAASVRRFNADGASQDNTLVLCISADLPFAQKRFCGGEGLDGVVNLSDFRHKGFGDAYGVRMVDGPLAGMLSRAVVVVGADGVITHTEQVPEIAKEPDYDAALKA